MLQQVQDVDAVRLIVAQDQRRLVFGNGAGEGGVLGLDRREVRCPVAVGVRPGEQDAGLRRPLREQGRRGVHFQGWKRPRARRVDGRAVRGLLSGG